MNKIILGALISSCWVNLACGMNNNGLSENGSNQQNNILEPPMNLEEPQYDPNALTHIGELYMQHGIYYFNQGNGLSIQPMAYIETATNAPQIVGNGLSIQPMAYIETVTNAPQIVMNDVSTPLADVAAPQQQNINQQGINDQGNYAMEPIIQNSAPTDTPSQDLLPLQNEGKITPRKKLSTLILPRL